MTYVGYLAGIIIFASVWAVFATGRKSWLVTAFWAGIMFVMSLGVKRGLEVNGLCLLIAMLETLMTIRATYGIGFGTRALKTRVLLCP